MEIERGSLVEHRGKFSSITLKGEVPARNGGLGSIELDEAVPKHCSKLSLDILERMM